METAQDIVQLSPEVEACLPSSVNNIFLGFTWYGQVALTYGDSVVVLQAGVGLSYRNECPAAPEKIFFISSDRFSKFLQTGPSKFSLVDLMGEDDADIVVEHKWSGPPEYNWHFTPTKGAENIGEREISLLEKIRSFREFICRNMPSAKFGEPGKENQLLLATSERIGSYPLGDILKTYTDIRHSNFDELRRGHNQPRDSDAAK